MVHEVTDESFQSEVAESPLPCVVLFTAGWCTLCPQVLEAMEALSGRMEGQVKFCTANVDEQRKLRIAFAVAALPYTVFVRDGMKTPLFDQVVGEEQLEERVRYMLDHESAPGTAPLRPM